MATTTYTASTFLAPIKSHHAGLNALCCHVVPTNITGWSGTVGSTIKLFKLPDRARIVGGYYSMIDADAQLTMRLRYRSSTGSSTTSAGLKLCSGSANGTTMIGLDGAVGILVPNQLSASASSIVSAKNASWEVEAVIASATMSLGCSVQLYYNMDDGP